MIEKKVETFNKLYELILTPEKHSLITIPPNIWNGFKGLDDWNQL